MPIKYVWYRYTVKYREFWSGRRGRGCHWCFRAAFLGAVQGLVQGVGWITGFAHWVVQAVDGVACQLLPPCCCAIAHFLERDMLPIFTYTVDVPLLIGREYPEFFVCFRRRPQWVCSLYNFEIPGFVMRWDEC